MLELEFQFTYSSSVKQLTQHLLVYHRMGDSDLEIYLFFLLHVRKQADSAPLMTRAMREVREESEMYKYDKVSILIKLHLRMLFKQEVVLEKEGTFYFSHFLGTKFNFVLIWSYGMLCSRASYKLNMLQYLMKLKFPLH